MKIGRISRSNLEGPSSWLIILLFVISDKNELNIESTKVDNVNASSMQKLPATPKSTKALKNVSISIPQAVKFCVTVTLQCNYDLEGEQLYTIKWYKGTREFFRYIPKESPSVVVFPISGIDIDLTKSGPKEVVLLKVQPEVTGRYYCEVSTDFPNFDTQMDSNFMYVVDVPKDNSIMEIRKENLGNGYKLKANCTSPPSFPAINITWYINGIKVNEIFSKKISIDPEKQPSKNRRTPSMTVSYMEKEIDDSIHQGEVVKVQCIATLFNLYRSENLRYIDDNRPQPWPSSIIGNTTNLSATVRVPIWIETLILVAFCILR